LRDAIVDSLGVKVKDFKLTPSRGGCFELKVDGQLIYSKLATGTFPNTEAVVDAVVSMQEA